MERMSDLELGIPEAKLCARAAQCLMRLPDVADQLIGGVRSCCVDQDTAQGLETDLCRKNLELFDSLLEVAFQPAVQPARTVSETVIDQY